jgi:hypothetical protein
VIAACTALYFNLFVLVVQAFEKVPALNAIAPTQKEPPFSDHAACGIGAFCGPAQRWR